ncbi:WGR domain-containing protein (plasmid) [Bradyrhizobium denitrificans]
MSELTVQYLVLERRDPARNMARFYVLTIEPTLFGEWGPSRWARSTAARSIRWSRAGRRGRTLAPSMANGAGRNHDGS